MGIIGRYYKDETFERLRRHEVLLLILLLRERNHGACRAFIAIVPLVIALVVLAIVVYVFVAWVKSPLRAKEILIKLFTVITIVLSVAFGLASLYAFFEHNVKVLEITGTFLVVSLVALGITRICRWRFVKRHPQYKNKAMPTKYL